ncbi:MAG: hypothetical protein ACJ74X_11080 [Gaiellaceae bacterium]
MTSIEPARTSARPAGWQLIAVVISARSWVIRLAIGAAVAAAILVYAILRDGFAEGGMRVLALIGILAAAAPPVMLAALWVALGELVRFPERVGRLPRDARDHGRELRALYEEARSERGRRLHVPRLLWQLTRTSGSLRETLTPYAPLLPLASVPFLIASAAAGFAAGLEIVVACIVLIVVAG